MAVVEQKARGTQRRDNQPSLSCRSVCLRRRMSRNWLEKETEKGRWGMSVSGSRQGRAKAGDKRSNGKIKGSKTFILSRPQIWGGGASASTRYKELPNIKVKLF